MSETNSASPVQKPWDAERIVRETGKVILELANAAVKTTENFTGLMIIRADREMRNKLDMIVESDAVKSRHEALEVLVKAGMLQKQHIFDQIEKTRGEIAALKNGLKKFAGIS